MKESLHWILMNLEDLEDNFKSTINRMESPPYPFSFGYFDGPWQEMKILVERLGELCRRLEAYEQNSTFIEKSI